jgi:uncharacterized membrane protein
MSKKKNKKKQEKIEMKKAVVLGTEKKSRVPLFVAIIGIVILAGAAGFYLSRGGDSLSSIASAPSATGSVVTFPTSLFEDGKARHFEHVNGKLAIRYFILKSSDGIIRAAFDACDVCWPAGKGYYQDGDFMVCRNCGRRFASVLVNEVKGGCNPAPLKRTLENGKLVIRIQDIIDGQGYFDLEGKA